MMNLIYKFLFDFDYYNVGGLSNEIREKLANNRPVTIGAALTFAGINPPAIVSIVLQIRRARISDVLA